MAREIRAEAVRLGLDQKQLAAASDLKPSYLSTRLRGEKPLDLNDMVDLATALKLSPMELMRRTEIAVKSNGVAATHAPQVKSIEPRADAETAIRADPTLSQDQRRMLLAMLNAMQTDDTAIVTAAGPELTVTRTAAPSPELVALAAEQTRRYREEHGITEHDHTDSDRSSDSVR